MPAIPDQVLSSSCGPGELRREALDPAVDRDVIDLDPALGQELLDVPVGEAEPQVPTDRQGDDFGWETVPGEGRTGRWVWVRVRGVISSRESPLMDGPAPNATVPALEVVLWRLRTAVESGDVSARLALAHFSLAHMGKSITP
jgi:hypothetical protein